MSDIVERLNQIVTAPIAPSYCITAREAVVEIERLREDKRTCQKEWAKRDNERLRAVVTDYNQAIEILRTENNRLRDECVNMRQMIGEIDRQHAAEVERLRADNARLNELFALKWDATQSAETAATRADNERLRDKALVWEAKAQELTDDNERLRAVLKPLVQHFSIGGGKVPIGKMLEDARRELEGEGGT